MSFISRAVLFVADLFNPVDNLTVELFLNGEVRYRDRQRSPVPVFLAGREPDHVTGMDSLDRGSPALCPAATGRDNESLAERMRMPCRPRTRLKRYIWERRRIMLSPGEGWRRGLLTGEVGRRWPLARL
jgi:hypothetical protein